LASSAVTAAAKEFVTAGIRNRVASGAPFDALWQGGAR
jgi:pyridoxine kinase